ncbi:MAG: iron-sulfur cluster assembly scaffold protein [Dehalococcoidia bacterium]|nr:iron-sulfur cluster assembly scaffold protein [Dehalococcoidia bacterium]
MEPYSATVMDHFENPRNSGELENPDAEATRSNPAMRVHMMLRIEDGRVTDVRWQTKGCPASIASSSFASDMIRGWTLEEVEALGKDSVAEAIGGLPAAKMHCSALTADVLKAAIADYRERVGAGS